MLFFFPEFETSIEADSQEEALEKLNGHSKKAPESIEWEGKTSKKWNSSKK